MEQKNNRRRKLIIEKRLQIRFLGIPLLAVVLNTIFFLSIIIYAVIKVPQIETEQLSPYYIIIASSVLVFCINTAIIAYLSLIASNRFIGPLYRLRKSIDALIQGNYGGKIQFRSHDFQYRLAQVYNDLSHTLKERVHGDIDFIDGVLEKLASLEPVQGETKEAVALIKADLGAYRKQKLSSLEIE